MRLFLYCILGTVITCQGVRTKFESLVWAEYVYRVYHLQQLDKNTVTDNVILQNHVIWY